MCPNDIICTRKENEVGNNNNFLSTWKWEDLNDGEISANWWGQDCKYFDRLIIET